MTEEQKQQFKSKLLEEKAELENQLKSIGRINPDNPGDWEAVQTEINVLDSDKNESADNIEGYENNTAILKQLETRYNEVIHALKKFDDGNYGKCEVSGENIEIERLEANPAARTSIAHKGEEKPLI